jgi:hypothetical protein
LFSISKAFDSEKSTSQIDQIHLDSFNHIAIHDPIATNRMTSTVMNCATYESFENTSALQAMHFGIHQRTNVIGVE